VLVVETMMSPAFATEATAAANPMAAHHLERPRALLGSWRSAVTPLRCQYGSIRRENRECGPSFAATRAGAEPSASRRSSRCRSLLVDVQEGADLSNCESAGLTTKCS
jgi:hypothetical protein